MLSPLIGPSGEMREIPSESVSGDAMPVAGDFVSEPVIARRGERDLALRIARVQP